jgi:glc operon protein GlcG
MYQSQHLSHKDAQAIIAYIQKKLEDDHKAASIAVVDAQGELLAFLRLDGCKLPSITIAINKAFTAAREHKETRTIFENSLADGFPMSNFGDLRYTNWGGGVPIMYENEVIGAVGVSGLPENEDMVLARMGSSAWIK